MCLNSYRSFWNLCLKKRSPNCITFNPPTPIKCDPSLLYTKTQDPVYPYRCPYICISTHQHAPHPEQVLSGVGGNHSSVLRRQVIPKSQLWSHPSETSGQLRDTFPDWLIFDKQCNCFCLQCGSACSGNQLIGTALPRHSGSFTLNSASLLRLNTNLGKALRPRGGAGLASLQQTRRSQRTPLCSTPPKPHPYAFLLSCHAFIHLFFISWKPTLC